MERLAAQPHQHENQERRKSFDMAASVNMMRADLQRESQILPETRERILNEELSYLTEGFERASRTAFELRREHDQPVYFDRGQWRPYVGMLLTGEKTARQEAQSDPRRTFLHDWAVRDLEYGYEMQGLHPGDSMIWDSRYPQAVEDRYGAKFVQALGLHPESKRGFIYRAFCQEDGSILLESQTVDNSDDDAFDAALTAARYDPGIGLDALVRTYDGAMFKKYGERFYAGRRSTGPENAWQEVQKYQDLQGYLLQGIEKLAHSELAGQPLEHAVKRHIYGVWAAFKKRIDGVEQGGVNIARPGVAFNVLIEQEVQRAFEEFAAEGRALIGCGGVILQGEENILNANPSTVFEALFGRKNTETYKFDKRMYCVVCQAPPNKEEQKSQAKKKCGPCGICKDCDKKLSAKR